LNALETQVGGVVALECFHLGSDTYSLLVIRPEVMVICL
jgi:hypothetical protein